MNERHACLILNGKHAANEQVRAAVQAFRARGWRLDVRVTWEAGDIERFVREQLVSGCRHFVAAGGDGTLSAVVGAFMTEVPDDAGATLAFLPLGTANDFALAAGIPTDPLQALELLETPVFRVDIGAVGERYFLNMATGGFGTEVTTMTPEELKRVLGGGAYLLSGLTHFSNVEPLAGHFRGEDFSWQGRFLAFGVGNGRQAGGGQRLCPGASIDDGLLDLCIIPAPADTVGALGTLLTGGFLGVEAVSVHARLKEVTLQTERDISVNLDGEPMQGDVLRFRTLPGAIALHLPADCPLLQAGSDRQS